MSHAFVGIRTDIGLTEHALDQLNHGWEETGQQEAGFDWLSSGFGDLSQAIVVANRGLQLIRSTWQGIQALGERADARTRVDAQLGRINDGLRTQEELETRVMQAAHNSRAAYETTATLVASIGRQDYFKGDHEAAVQFAEVINKGLVVSGASVTEADSAILQLTQGLASGVLRGEEFNSILQNAPVLVEMMSKSLGVTEGELRALAEEGALTTEVVVSSLLQQTGAIDEEFSKMPMSFGQACLAFENYVSQLMNSLSQPDQAVGILIAQLEELNAWAGTAEGTRFFNGMASGITLVIECIVLLGATAGEVYGFFADNWTLISPILSGITTFVVALTVAYLAYRGVMLGVQAVEAVMGAVKMISTGQTMAQTTAQWGLNAALLANPITWIVLAVLAYIAVMVTLITMTINLWKTNVDFKVGVISIWNSILNWFDQVPIFFMGIGYGILDSFSDMKVGMMVILEAMVNGAIERINRLIELANRIPGVAIDTLDTVSFGTQTAIAEQAKRAGRAAELAKKQAEAAAKASARSNELAKDEIGWRAEAAAQKEKALADKAADPVTAIDGMGGAENSPPIQLGGGTIDQVGRMGGEVDLSDQSLEYFHDIAEIQALERVNHDATQSYLLEGGEAQLSDSDADFLQTGAGQSTNIYYLNYNGGVNVQNSIKKGENWEEIKQSLYDEAESEIESGLSDIEEALY